MHENGSISAKYRNRIRKLTNALNAGLREVISYIQQPGDKFCEV
jgi:hypothetical protein